MTATNNHKKGTKVNPTDQHTKTPHTATGLLALLGGLLRGQGSGAPKFPRGSGVFGRAPEFITTLTMIAATLLASAALSAALPAEASAYATIEGPPQFSAAPGLPDGRIYEQVSPGDKNGNQAGASTTPQNTGAVNHYGLAAADGNAVLFEGTGPMGESPSGSNRWFVATKKPGEPGWSTRSLTPAVRGLASGNGLAQLAPSSDLSHAVVEGDLVDQSGCEGGLYLTGPDPFLAGQWLERTELADPVEHCNAYHAAPIGGTANFSTVYFTYGGTLLGEDSERAQHAGGDEAWGFYENREGVLHEEGVLPDGKLDPFGAVPAASGHGRATVGNEVSSEASPDGARAGSRAFFVSPDPASCAANKGQNDCVTDPPELYVRENGERTLLVSTDTLLPEVGGLPASAPGGVLGMANPVQQHEPSPEGSYVFASPDGSQAFFQSASALTKLAEEASPGGEPKTYEFDVETGVLTYLPGVVGEILATDGDGSSLAFLRPEVGAEPARLELWSAGAGGGSVAPVVQLPSRSVPEARMSNNGSALLFQTASRLSGAFNGGGLEQIYRYNTATNTLGCASCAPAGVTPGAASMSIMFTDEERGKGLSRYESSVSIVDQRGISGDGDRVFFETPTPLVPQDSNTNTSGPCSGEGQGIFCAQGDDVYEWENGVVYLISTGRSSLDSYLLDSSENGDDIFIVTSEGLVPGDTDGGYDVYDARVPHEGEPYPPAAVPCEGSVCQGPPNVPSPLTPPASATFSGLGNPAPEGATIAPETGKAAVKRVSCKKNDVRKNDKCVKSKAKRKAKKASNDRRVKS